MKTSDASVICEMNNAALVGASDAPDQMTPSGLIECSRSD